MVVSEVDHAIVDPAGSDEITFPRASRTSARSCSLWPIRRLPEPGVTATAAGPEWTGTVEPSPPPPHAIHSPAVATTPAVRDIERIRLIGPGPPVDRLRSPAGSPCGREYPAPCSTGRPSSSTRC